MPVNSDTFLFILVNFWWNWKARLAVCEAIPVNFEAAADTTSRLSSNSLSKFARPYNQQQLPTR